jgi:hypothetical protein
MAADLIHFKFPFVTYTSTIAAAKCCYRLWEYDNILKKEI